MFNHSWKKELFTIPNFLSLFRLLLIPTYVYLYLNATQPSDYYLAGTILGISCLTDFADGKIARDFHMVSEVGKLLDPLADKLTQFTLLITLSQKYQVLYPVLFLFLVKETFQCVCLLLFIQKGKVLPGALLVGKICTAALFVSLIILVLFPNISRITLQLIVTVDSFLIINSFFGYTMAYFGKNPKLTDLHYE